MVDAIITNHTHVWVGEGNDSVDIPESTTDESKVNRSQGEGDVNPIAIVREDRMKDHDTMESQEGNEPPRMETHGNLGLPEFESGWSPLLQSSIRAPVQIQARSLLIDNPVAAVQSSDVTGAAVDHSKWLPARPAAISQRD